MVLSSFIGLLSVLLPPMERVWVFFFRYSQLVLNTIETETFTGRLTFISFHLRRMKYRYEKKTTSERVSAHRFIRFARPVEILPFRRHRLFMENGVVGRLGPGPFLGRWPVLRGAEPANGRGTCPGPYLIAFRLIRPVMHRSDNNFSFDFIPTWSGWFAPQFSSFFYFLARCFGFVEISLILLLSTVVFSRVSFFNLSSNFLFNLSHLLFIDCVIIIIILTPGHFIFFYLWIYFGFLYFCTIFCIKVWYSWKLLPLRIGSFDLHDNLFFSISSSYH